MAEKLQYITFYNGQKMPIVGLGTWQSPGNEVGEAVDVALEAGYRHIDTAYRYMNEAQIGAILKKWLNSGRVKREDLFIVTKLPPVGNRAASVEKYLKKSLAALQLDYVDLYLIHHATALQEAEDKPFLMGADGKPLFDIESDHISLWKGMEAQVDAGRARSIGLSNFNARQIKRIWQSARIKPANLQVELHLYFQQKELRAFCRALDVTVCAYAPLGSPGMYTFMEKMGTDTSSVPKHNQLDDSVVKKIALKYGKTTAQVLLRQIMQLGVAVIPKSTNPDRVKQNFNVFDFELSLEDMEALDALDKGRNGRQAGLLAFPGQENHPEYPFYDPY